MSFSFWNYRSKQKRGINKTISEGVVESEKEEMQEAR
jgi:hypothetical protein